MIRLVFLRFIESYLSHRWLYLVPALLFTAVGVAYAYVQPATYISSGVIYIENETYLSYLTSVRDSEYLWSPSQLVSNQINDLLRTDAFVRAVMLQTDLEAAMGEGNQPIGEIMEEVRDAIWASPIGDNHMSINALHEDREIAHQLAQGAIDSFTQWQVTNDLNQSVAAEEFLSGVIVQYADEMQAARTALQNYLTEHPEPVVGDRPTLEQLEVEQLRRNLDIATERYSSALDKEENARLATAQTESDVRQRFFVVDAPAMPSSSTRGVRSMAVDVMIFGILGGLISSALIVGGIALDRTVRLPMDAETLLDVPLLGAVPRAKEDDIPNIPAPSPGKGGHWQVESSGAGPQATAAD